MIVFADKPPTLALLIEGVEASLQLQASLVAAIKAQSASALTEHEAQQRVYPLIDLLRAALIDWQDLRALEGFFKEQTSASRQEKTAQFMRSIHFSTAPFHS